MAIYRTYTLSRRRALIGAGAMMLSSSYALASEDVIFEDFGRLARVIDGDSIVLENGLKLRLSNIMAPEKDQPFTHSARSALETLLTGRKLGVYYVGEKRDRYDRAIAQLFTLRPDGRPDQWVQAEMLRLGYARVRSFASSAWRISELLDIENKAREAGRGLWQSPVFAVRSPAPNALAQDVDSFQIVQGLIISSAQVRGQTYLNFGSDYKTDFTVSISRKHRKSFESAGIELTDLEGARVRVRGWIELYNGPVIWLDHPDQFEFVQANVT
jgi:endonuclease YncB( thermonuclease family)